MNGRVYDAGIARFISSDPTIPYPLRNQAYNRYSYTENNPNKYTDPSGYGHNYNGGGYSGGSSYMGVGSSPGSGSGSFNTPGLTGNSNSNENRVDPPETRENENGTIEQRSRVVSSNGNPINIGSGGGTLGGSWVDTGQSREVYEHLRPNYYPTVGNDTDFSGGMFDRISGRVSDEYAMRTVACSCAAPSPSWTDDPTDITNPYSAPVYGGLGWSIYNAAKALVGYYSESSRDLDELETIHEADHPENDPEIGELSDKELLDAITNPANGDGVTVRGNRVLDGNTRINEAKGRGWPGNTTIPVTELPTLPENIDDDPLGPYGR